MDSKVSEEGHSFSERVALKSLKGSKAKLKDYCSEEVKQER